MRNKWSPHNRNSSSHREIGQMAHVKGKIQGKRDKILKKPLELSVKGAGQ